MKKNSAPKCSKHSDCFSIAATQLGPFPTSWYLRAQEAFGPLVRSEGVAHFGFTVRKEHFNFAVPPTHSPARSSAGEENCAASRSITCAPVQRSLRHHPATGKNNTPKATSLLQTCIQDWYPYP